MGLMGPMGPMGIMGVMGMMGRRVGSETRPTLLAGAVFGEDGGGIWFGRDFFFEEIFGKIIRRIIGTIFGMVVGGGDGFVGFADVEFGVALFEIGDHAVELDADLVGGQIAEHGDIAKRAGLADRGGAVGRGSWIVVRGS